MTRRVLFALSTACLLVLSSATPAASGPDPLGFIDVFEFRSAVSQLERLLPTIDEEFCETSACEADAYHQSASYEEARAAFMREWGSKLLAAIAKGDEVAEVIWRQCKTTPVIERSALASTCDADPARRKEAAQRLRQIGFEAAFDEEAEGSSLGWEPDQHKRTVLHQARILRDMAAGVYGSWSIGASTGGNAVRSPEDLMKVRRAAVIDAASTLVRRSFTYARRQGDGADRSHAVLRLNRKPIGTPTLGWSANVFHGKSPYTGVYDPAWNGFNVSLEHEKSRAIVVAGDRDAQYLRMLHDTLKRSEQRIDYWLGRDPRWSVFLLHRHGHHEWVPEGMPSPFGRLNPSWHGQWRLAREFVNFAPGSTVAADRLRIQVGDAQSIAQFDPVGAPAYACELRYSDANSFRPDANSHATSATSTALGYLPALSPIPPGAAGPVEPFAPLNPRNAYRQVLVQCPEGEWPDNRNKHFFFLARNTIVDVSQAEGSRDLTIRHWRREAALDADAGFSPLAPVFDLRSTLARLAQDGDAAEKADAQVAELRARASSMGADELIASLAHLRLQELWYIPDRDFPGNLVKLIDTPGIATKICEAYRANPPDALQRFNFMVVLNARTKDESLTSDELAVVPDCLRLALDDPEARVRVEALNVFSAFAQEKDRAKLTELLNDVDEDVRRQSHNALQWLGESWYGNE